MSFVDSFPFCTSFHPIWLSFILSIEITFLYEFLWIFNRFSPIHRYKIVNQFVAAKRLNKNVENSWWNCDLPELELLQRSLPPRLQRMFPLHFESPSLMAVAVVNDNYVDWRSEIVLANVTAFDFFFTLNKIVLF